MQKNLKILLFSLSLSIGFLFIGCKQTAQPQEPTSYSNDGFMAYSKEFNKQLKEKENKEIKNYIENHTVDFVQTNAGFFMTKTRLGEARVVKNKDSIVYYYQIKNLKDSLLYSYKDNGRQVIVMGQTNIIQGIEYGLKRMSEGENATILLPSSLAYGVKGDRNKIGTDQPLVVDLKLENIINYE